MRTGFIASFAGDKMTIILAIITILGLLGTLWGMNSIRVGIASNRWPDARGSIISSEVGEIHSADSGSGTGSTKYHPKVIYAYLVDNQKYESIRISAFSYGSSSRQRALDITQKKYPLGRNVDVYYNPKYPKIAVLEKGVGFFAFIPILVGLPMLLFGVLRLLGIIL